MICLFFREDQADEYTSLKKELEQTAKNCRILSFKLRKSERKAESVEAEKAELEKRLKEVGLYHPALVPSIVLCNFVSFILYPYADGRSPRRTRENG